MFKVLFLFSTVLVAAKATPASNDLNHIGVVGGKDAKEMEFPYMVSLRLMNRKTHRCGGSILSLRTILTVAHCVEEREPNEFEAWVGSIYVNTGGDCYKISKIIIHPDYNKPYDVANDIALLVTNESISTGPRVAIIGLPTSITGPGETVTLTGWGWIKLMSHRTNTLQKITLLTLSEERCNRTRAAIADHTNICTLTKAGEGACYGDSGSPLAIGNEVVGIMSRGRPCAVGYPDVSVRVTSYLPWILLNMS